MPKPDVFTSWTVSNALRKAETPQERNEVIAAVFVGMRTALDDLGIEIYQDHKLRNLTHEAEYALREKALQEVTA